MSTHADLRADALDELPRDVLAAVRRIQLRARRVVNESLAGHYLSTFRGVGMEFDEVRVYAPGDDVRAIDWNVTARTGVPHIKRYVEERELTVMLLVDVSASSEFGSRARSRAEVAAEMCALLALSATINNDKVGLVLFGDEVERYIPPKKGRRHVLRVIREVLTHRPHRGTTRIDEALAYLNRVQRRRATVFLLSDFLVEQRAWTDLATSLRIASRRHDVVAVSLDDPRESEFPSTGLVELEDLETGERRLVDTSSRAVQKAFATAARERREDRRQQLQRLGVDEVNVDVSGDWIEPLVRFFRVRESRLRSGR